MIEKTIEAVLCSPPERNELIVQLFHRDGGQWGEIYRDNDSCLIELFIGDKSLFLNADELSQVLLVSLKKLRARLESS